jgi:hypothetical protein
MQAPSFIQRAGVLELAPEFPWKGSGQHHGESQGTPLHKNLQRVTYLGTTAIASRSLEWLMWRLQSAIDHPRIMDAVDAMYAWTIDPRYKKHDDLLALIPRTTPPNQAAFDAFHILVRMTNDNRWLDPDSPDHNAAAIGNVCKQTLTPKTKKAFTEWQKWAVERAQALAARPTERRPRFQDFHSKEAFR